MFYINIFFYIELFVESLPTMFRNSSVKTGRLFYLHKGIH